MRVTPEEVDAAFLELAERIESLGGVKADETLAVFRRFSAAADEILDRWLDRTRAEHERALFTDSLVWILTAAIIGTLIIPVLMVIIALTALR